MNTLKEQIIRQRHRMNNFSEVADNVTGSRTLPLEAERAVGGGESRHSLQPRILGGSARNGQLLR